MDEDIFGVCVAALFGIAIICLTVGLSKSYTNAYEKGYVSYTNGTVSSCYGPACEVCK